MKSLSGIFSFLALLLSFHLVTGFKGVTTEEERVSVCQRTCRGPHVVFEVCCNEISQILYHTSLLSTFVNLNNDYRKRSVDDSNLYEGEYRFGKRGNTVVLDENDMNPGERYL